jgi:hypothetical protein
MLEEVANLIKVVLISSTLIFTLFDNILIFIVKARKPLIDNKYFEFHRNHGFLKITFLKLIIALLVVYSLIEPIGKSGALAAIIWAYAFFVIKLLIDFIRKKKNKKAEKT